jgi:signal recognition particle GTPase
MTEKSVFTDGKYHGWTVQKIIDCGFISYLRWVYFNMEKISFTESVLIKLKFQERISKPGIDKQTFDELQKNLAQRNYDLKTVDELKKEIAAKHLNKQNISHQLLDAYRNKKIKRIKVFVDEFKDVKNKKSVLQLRNQGH